MTITRDKNGNVVGSSIPAEPVTTVYGDQLDRLEDKWGWRDPETQKYWAPVVFGQRRWQLVEA